MCWQLLRAFCLPPWKWTLLQEDSAYITITGDESLKEEIKYEIQKDGKFSIAITCGSFNPHSLSKEQQEKSHLKYPRLSCI